jgi:murE/murF fusion protein
LNADDGFFKFHKKLALKNKLKVITFGIKNKKSNVKLISIKRNIKNYKINIRINDLQRHFFISNDFQNNIYNILATLAIMSINTNILKLNKNIFLNFETPEGRGDLSKLKINNKNINLIDESYNSNPLSLKSAILNYDKINLIRSKKYLLLGDMLELGNHSKKLHRSIVPLINKTKIDKVFVKGKDVILIFKNLSQNKKGRILHSKSQIIELIKNDLNNNDYLMIKASNATGFNKIVKDIKGLN